MGIYQCEFCDTRDDVGNFMKYPETCFICEFKNQECKWNNPTVCPSCLELEYCSKWDYELSKKIRKQKQDEDREEKEEDEQRRKEKEERDEKYAENFYEVYGWWGLEDFIERVIKLHMKKQTDELNEQMENLKCINNDVKNKNDALRKENEILKKRIDKILNAIN